jgi:hypothetical protein
MNKVLIITFSNDNECIETVTHHLEKLGAKVIRFNVDLYPTQYALSSVYENGQWQVSLDHNDQQETLHDVTAVWFRRCHHLANELYTVLEKEYLPSVTGDVQQTLFGMLEGFGCFSIGSYSMYRRLESKEEQLKIATGLGLKVPDTCISNHPEGVIAKMQSSFALYREGKEHVVFTNIVRPDDIVQLENLQYCPMQFQQKIEKTVELRVTIVGDQVFAFAVDSQQMENARTDWRKEGIALLEQWQPYTLPERIREQLLQLTETYQINYGAIDIIVDPAGDYYFLEINAAGEYFWLDRVVDGQISAQIAKVLCGQAYRRYYQPSDVRKETLLV